MDAILAIAREHGIAVIEDASHAHGAEYKGRKMGTLGTFGAFSFQASKNLPGGEGGMLLTDNEDYYRWAIVVGHYREAAGLPEKYSRYSHTSFGFKYRLSPLHAAIARVIALPTFPGDDGALVDQYLEAFRKVAESFK